MTYTLTLDLAGADKIDASLDRLLDKVSQLGTGGAGTGGGKTPKESFEEWADAEIGGGGSGSKKSGSGKPPILDKVAQRIERDAASYYKNMSMLMGPLMNPGGGLSTMFAARQVFSAFMTQHGQQQLAKFGLSGMAGAGIGTVALTGGAMALGFAFQGLKKVVDEVANAYSRAASLYSKAMTSGMGLSFSAQRGMLAQIMGVSETEVFKFGDAMHYLNPKIKHASNVLAGNAKELTAVNWEFQVLQANLAASASIIAVKAAPAITRLIEKLNDLSNWINEHSEKIVAPFNAAASASRNEEKYAAFINFAERFNLAVEGMHIQGQDDIATNMKLFRKGEKNPYTKAMDLFLKDWEKSHPSNKSSIPDPSALMKQMPASAWEHMGMVVGGVSVSKTTNDLIRKSNSYLQTIANAVGGGVPNSSGSFNLNPTVGNP